MRLADHATGRRAFLAGTVADGSALDPETARLVLQASAGATALPAAFQAAAAANLAQMAADMGDRRIGLDVLGVPPGATIVLDVRLESVSEGVYVSGTAAVPLAGECARCLDELTDEVTVELGELFAYPDSVTDETTDDDELPRVVDEHVDLEQTVRDAVDYVGSVGHARGGAG